MSDSHDGLRSRRTRFDSWTGDWTAMARESPHFKTPTTYEIRSALGGIDPLRYRGTSIDSASSRRVERRDRSEER
ncbi:MAG TPA: hypothetical protein DCQ98_20420 [Planctomycetaceae bacterium]|nr:hypothetical protein [Planctomycetaceae bacterium]